MRKDKSEEEHWDPCEVWRKLNWDLWKEEEGGRKKFEEVSGIRDTTLSTVLGGKDRRRLSKNYLKRMECCHIQLGGIRSPARLQEYLDVMRRLPGYMLDAKQEEWLRRAANEELETMGVPTIDYLSTALHDLYKGVRAVDKETFSQWEQKEDRKFQPLFRYFRSWRQE